MCVPKGLGNSNASTYVALYSIVLLDNAGPGQNQSTDKDTLDTTQLRIFWQLNHAFHFTTLCPLVVA